MSVYLHTLITTETWNPVLIHFDPLSRNSKHTSHVCDVHNPKCLLTKTEKKKKKQAREKWAKCTRKDKDPTEIMGLLSEHEKRKKK